MLDAGITINNLLAAIGVVVAVVSGGKALKSIIGFINEKHDEKQKIEAHDKMIQELRDDTNAKLQEIRAEQYILTFAMNAVLDGLHQLKCNGKVTEAKEELDKFMNERAHEK